jgi:hypothetical protein
MWTRTNPEGNILWKVATSKTKEDVEKCKQVLSRIGEFSRTNLSDWGHCEIIFPMNTPNLSVG